MSPGDVVGLLVIGVVLGITLVVVWHIYAESKGWLRIETAYPDQPWNFTRQYDEGDTWESSPERALLRKENQEYWGVIRYWPKDERPANVAHREEVSKTMLHLAAEHGSVPVTPEEMEYYRSLERYVALVEPHTEEEWPPKH